MQKLWRSMQVNFPYLLDTKHAARSLMSRVLRLPQERDFCALALFPDLDRALYLDVGANRGQSIEAILMLTKNSVIMSFEPNRLLWSELARRFGNNQRVTVNAFGLGNQDGRHNLYVPYYRSWMYDGLASFKRDGARYWFRDRIFGFQERHVTLKEIECTIRRLDDLELAPFFIKLDVEGYEFEALTGGEKTLTKHEPILLVEGPDEKTTHYLQGLGYRYYRFARGTFVPHAMGALNTFFMTENKAALVKHRIVRS